MTTSTGIQPKKTFTVSVEGNIGSGKTTFLNYFNGNPNVATFAEPIDIWRNCKGYNLLNLMYEDPIKWSFTFQSFVQLTMLQIHHKKVPQPVKLMERSLYSAQYCFIEKMAKDSLMPAPSSYVLREWFEHMSAKADSKIDLIVYLRTSPEIAYDRILKRNRSEEKTILLDYVQALHELHEDWLFHKTTHFCPAPILVLNANLDKSVIIEEYEKYETRILNKVMG